MKYVSPEFVTDAEVIAGIADATTDHEVIDVALSAIYHCDTEIAGNVLLEAYQKVLGSNRLFLGNITQTFLQMHGTTYRIDEFIEEMRKEGPDPILMADNIEGAIEFKKMYSDSPASNEGANYKK